MTPIFTKVLFLFCLSDICWAELKPDCKNYKVTTHDSFACVCTETKPCDPILRPEKTPAGVVTKWQSSREGARLRKQTLHFGKFDDVNFADDTEELKVNVNRSVRHQEIFGFGGAFTDSTAINIMKRIGPKLGQQIIEGYYSKDGLEYNVGRVPIAGSDFSIRAYAYDDNGEDKTLKNFNLTDEDFLYKIPLILKAQSLATHNIRLFASPWSAPSWMKTNNNLTNGGSIKGPVGSEYWQIYAKYFVKFLNAYKSNNITFWGLTVQNEPFAIQNFNSMYYTPEMMRDFLANTLGPELERSGWGIDKLKVMIWDHNLDHVQEWVKIIFADKTASKYAAGTAIHWYSGTSQTVLDEPHKLHPDKFILATEACVGPGVKIGWWELAERYANDILMDLLHHTIGWTDWNMALDIEGGPVWARDPYDSPVIIDPQYNQYYRQPHFYAMAHFSKFLPPGSVRIDSIITSEKNSKAIVGSFRTPNNSTVFIAVNNFDTRVKLTINDTKEGTLLDTIEPKSIQTYVYYD